MSHDWLDIGHTNNPKGCSASDQSFLADILGHTQATYTWDANSNRKSAHYSRPRTSGTGQDTLTRTFTTGAGHNKTLSVAEQRRIDGTLTNHTRTFSWDAAGSLLGDGQNTFTPGPRAQMSSATTGADTTNPSTTHYTYNSASQRVQKRGPGHTTHYTYGLAELGLAHWPLHIQQEGQTATATEIIYLPTASGPMPIAVSMQEGSAQNLYAIHTDHLHTPRRLSDHQGNAVWQWVITGFGEMPATLAAHGFVPRAHAVLPPVASPTNQPLPAVDFALRYPGQVHDNETGLFYNHHRYYDPYLTVGYTHADPIGLAGGWNRFGYANANPLGFVDPSGLTPEIKGYFEDVNQPEQICGLWDVIKNRGSKVKYVKCHEHEPTLARCMSCCQSKAQTGNYGEAGTACEADCANTKYPDGLIYQSGPDGSNQSKPENQR